MVALIPSCLYSCYKDYMADVPRHVAVTANSSQQYWDSIVNNIQIKTMPPAPPQYANARRINAVKAPSMYPRNAVLDASKQSNKQSFSFGV